MNLSFSAHSFTNHSLPKRISVNFGARQAPESLVKKYPRDAGRIATKFAEVWRLSNGVITDPDELLTLAQKQTQDLTKQKPLELNDLFVMLKDMSGSFFKQHPEQLQQILETIKLNNVKKEVLTEEENKVTCYLPDEKSPTRKSKLTIFQLSSPQRLNLFLEYLNKEMDPKYSRDKLRKLKFRFVNYSSDPGISGSSIYNYVIYKDPKNPQFLQAKEILRS